jgi:ABC-type nitrate/sulfonate/bicarbonate transport system substrate-binding protein
LPNVSRSTLLGWAGAASVFGRFTPARADTVETIRVGTVAADAYAEPYYFTAAGVARKYGISLDVTTFTNGAGVASACAGNAIDVGITDALLVANAFNRGVPLTIIGGGGLFTPETANSYLCVARASPYKVAKDFEGQTIGVPTLGSSVLLTAIKAWLAVNGADLERIHFVEVPFGAMGAALERQTVAGATITEPFLSQIGPGVQRLASPYTSIGKQFLVSEWFTTRDWVAKNRSLAKKLVGAVYETARWANAHQDLTGSVLATNAKLDLESVRAMKRTIYATDFDARMVEPVLTAAARYKVIAQPTAVSDLVAAL